MSENQLPTIEQILAARAEAEETIKMYELVEKLHKNAAFKKVILEGFFKESAVRSAPLLAHPKGTAVREGAENTMIGIGALQMYFSALYNNAATAKSTLVELAQLEDELMHGE